MKEETEKILVNAIIDLGVNMENLRRDMNSQLGKVNLSIKELRLSVLKLDDRLSSVENSFNKYAQRNDERLIIMKPAFLILKENPAVRTWLMKHVRNIK